MIGPVYLGSGPHEEPRQPKGNRRRRFEPLPEEPQEDLASEEQAETEEEPVCHISVEG